MAGARPKFSARFSARCDTLPRENLDAEAFRFGGEGRNRLASPIHLRGKYLILLGFQAQLILTRYYFS
jgi:hypothetical protein